MCVFLSPPFPSLATTPAPVHFSTRGLVASNTLFLIHPILQPSTFAPVVLVDCCVVFMPPPPVHSHHHPFTHTVMATVCLHGSPSSYPQPKLRCPPPASPAPTDYRTMGNAHRDGWLCHYHQNPSWLIFVFFVATATFAFVPSAQQATTWDSSFQQANRSLPNTQKAYPRINGAAGKAVPVTPCVRGHG
jgi:hypothetical protein